MKSPKGNGLHDGGVCGQVATPQTPDLEVQGSNLAYQILSLDKELYPTLSVFTQVYKWVPVTYCLGVTLQWTNIPSRGE